MAAAQNASGQSTKGAQNGSTGQPASNTPLGAADSSGSTKPSKAHGLVTINRDSCKGCGFCVEFCPTHALELDKGFNAKGYHPPIHARPEVCVGCNMCGLYCPDFAIFGYRETPSAKKEEPKNEG